MDDDPAFDFGSWCVVCGRLVEPPQASTSTAPAGAGTSSTASSPAHSPSLPVKPTRKASVKRNKSSGKLHAHARSKSGSRLAGLAPSTQIHKGKAKDAAVASPAEGEQEGTGERGGSGHSTPSATAGDGQDELSSLYCSIECQRSDAAGGGTSGFKPTATTAGPPLLQRPPARHTSSSSLHSLHLAQSPSSFSPHQQFHHPPSSSAASLPGGLDFSNRRNSRGATYRPLAMSRTLSGGVDSGGAPGGFAASRNRSSGSLQGIGDDEARGTSVERGFPRPLSSLSAFRGMTPIPSPHPSTSHSPSLHSPTFPRPSGGRSKSDMPPPSHVARFSLDGDGSPQRERERGRHGRHEGETPEEREKRKAERRARKEASGRSASHGPSHGAARRSGHGSTAEMAQSVPATLGLGLEELHLSSRRQLPAPIPQRPPNRSSSSASLALMGTSFSSRSFDSRRHLHLQPQATVGRSESTASLSGLTAQGTILPPSTTGAGDASSPSTFIPPPLPRPPSYSPSHPRSSLSIPTALSSSPSSSTATSSSFNNSHHSQHSHYSGTSHSSAAYLSSSAGSHAGQGGRERGRTTRGLQMTASSASLAAEGREKSRTPKGDHHPHPHSQHPPPDRAASTPAAARRPTIYQTAPTPSPTPRRPSSSHSSHPSTSPHATRPSALQTPSLSYLVADEGISKEKRNFSWDQLGVKAYHSLDLDEVRAARDGDATIGRQAGKERKKKLFHFAMDDDE